DHSTLNPSTLRRCHRGDPIFSESQPRAPHSQRFTRRKSLPWPSSTMLILFWISTPTKPALLPPNVRSTCSLMTGQRSPRLPLVKIPPQFTRTSVLHPCLPLLISVVRTINRNST